MTATTALTTTTHPIPQDTVAAALEDPAIKKAINREPTPEQLEVLTYLDGFNLHYIANSEFAYLNLPPHLREIHYTTKGICNGAFLPNAWLTLSECLVGVMELLWENADTFAGLPQEERQEYVLELTRKVSNKAIRRPKELQLPEHTSDADISVPSCTCNPLELDKELPNYGRRVHQSKPDGVSHTQGRSDWVLAHQYENFLIADLDSRRAAAIMPEPEGEFERCERLLGADDADWYWTVRANHDLFPQRHPERHVLTVAERKRYQ